jgi:hypothetical protein
MTDPRGERDATLRLRTETVGSGDLKSLRIHSEVEMSPDIVPEPPSRFRRTMIERLEQQECLDEDAWILDKAKATLILLDEVQRKGETLGDVAVEELFRETMFILGAIWLLDRLGIRTVTSSPLPWSSTVDHSSTAKTLRSPQLLEGMPVLLLTTDERIPVLTDDGVALLKVLTGAREGPSTSNGGKAPTMTFHSRATGYEESPTKHTVSLIVGEVLGERTVDETRFIRDLERPNLWNVDRDLVVLETNIDDMTAEHLAFVVNKLLREGATDAWITPIVMKKGRPAHTLHCLCRCDLSETLLGIIFRHCTTLGVRVSQSFSRVSLRRRIVRVQTDWVETKRSGLVDVKVGYLGDEVVTTKAEFEHCKEISEAVDVPIQRIAAQATQKVQEELKGCERGKNA